MSKQALGRVVGLLREMTAEERLQVCKQLQRHGIDLEEEMRNDRETVDYGGFLLRKTLPPTRSRPTTPPILDHYHVGVDFLKRPSRSVLHTTYDELVRICSRSIGDGEES